MNFIKTLLKVLSLSHHGIFFVLFFILYFNLVSLSETNTKNLEINIQNFRPDSKSELPRNNEADFLIRDTYKAALNFFKLKNLDQASVQFVLLRSFLTDNNYQGAPDLSYELISLAGDRSLGLEERKYLLFQAEKLTSNHPGVLIASSSLRDVNGVFESSKKFVRGLLLLPEYPVQMGIVISRVFILFVLSYYFCILFLIVFHLVSYGGELYYSISRIYPKTIFGIPCRGLATVLTFVFILYLPLFLPAFITVICWGLMLLTFVPRPRFTALFMAFLLILSTFGMSRTRELLSILESPAVTTLERASNKLYAPRSIEVIEKIKKEDENNPYYHLLLGQIFHRSADLGLASEYYSKAENDAGIDRSITFLVRMNQGVIEYSKGNLSAAHNKWTELYNEGWNEFSLIYNLSISSVDMFDNETSLRLITYMQKNYPDEFRIVSEEQGERLKPLLASLPSNFLKDMIFNKIISGKGLFNQYTGESDNKDKIKYGFDLLGTAPMVFYKGLIILLLVIGIFRLKAPSQRYRGSLVTKRLFISLKYNVKNFRFFDATCNYLKSNELSSLMLLSYLSTVILIILNYPFSIVPSQQGGFVFLLPLVVLPACIGALVIVKKNMSNQ
ncbi:MAG TPA: hypothetical protein PKA63_00835 [Oligoflexia bacterium]|nr:hypothetical protein [Oligoflexia bacterium]HMP47195.1 hypothetical protein [Oligoflexia bacterium]